MSNETRPAVYLPIVTNEELIRYAESYAETALEKELLERLKNLIDEESEDAV